MPNTTITARYRFLGITDECVECQSCGKPNLRSTVVLAILDADGNDEDVTYYGSTCAARALGVTGRGASARVLGLARTAHRNMVLAANDAVLMLDHYGLPETGEPTRDQLNNAMQTYNLKHANMVAVVAETGIGVRARVLEMMTRYQATLAEAARLNVTVPRTTRELDRFLATS